MRGRDARRPAGAFSVSLFMWGLVQIGIWCKGNEGTRVSGFSCTKPAPAPEEKWPGTWCKENERTRVRGLSCTKPAPVPEEKWRETWCKGNGRTRVSGLSCTKPASRRRPRPEARHPDPHPGRRLHLPRTYPGGLTLRPAALRPPAVNPSTGSQSTHMSTFIFFRIIIKFTE